jgi:hypothetical protein
MAECRTWFACRLKGRRLRCERCSLDPSGRRTAVAYSGKDIGTTFPVHEVAAGAAAPRLPALTLTVGGT